MRKLIAIVFVLTITTQLPAIAYTQADVEACTPDAMRLCQQAFPSETHIILCLAKNKQKLSAACTMAFSRARSAGAAGGQQAGR